MIIDAKVPVIGESINEVTLSQWLVEEGDYVEMDQPICEFESDKATLEFPAEKAGTVTFVAEEGQDLAIGDVVAKIDTSAEAPVKTVAPVKTEVQAKETPAPKLSAPAAPTPIPIPIP
ncbi:MAG: 2-oxoglutarate dehydrogenase E2 component (dihydrolipoamide succinyltransferase), partial [Limisphaerales bacterium]